MPHSRAIAPISEIGRDSVGMAVATKRRRNKKITSTTKATVPAMVSETSCSASRTEMERSLIGFITTEPGICDCKLGKAARMVSTTLTVLAPGCRCTAIVMAFSPLKVAQVRMFSTLSSTLATSRRRTGLPPLLLMIRLANSRAVLSCLLACKTRVCVGPSKVPTGVFTLAERKAALTSSRPIFMLARDSGRTRTRTAKRLAP